MVGRSLQEEINYNPDIELVGSGNEDEGHDLADKILKEENENNLIISSEIAFASEFIRKVEKANIDPNDIFDNCLIKRNLYTEYTGYTKLKVNSKLSVSLKDCKPTRFGNAFKDFYYRELKKVEKGI